MEPRSIRKNATEAGLILMPIPVMWTFGAIFSGNLVGKLKNETNHFTWG
ncbi:hypothetical protein ACT7C5_14430 [Bacillus pacificus]